MAPTQKELAKLAGVSAGTVSNVVNGVPGVSETARQRVLAAIRELNYQPNLIARSLRTNRTHTLGIVVPDITVPFYPHIIRGAESAAREAGYFLMVLDSENDQEREGAMLELLRSQRSEGTLLVAAGGHGWSKEQATAITAQAPLVCLDRLPEGLAVDSVCVDDARAAAMAVSHLVERGHREIAVITGPPTLRNEQARLRGYRTAMQHHGLQVRDRLVWQAGFQQTEIARVCQEGLLGSRERPSAIFATNGVTGLGMLKALYALGLETPRDVAVVCFDELNGEDFFRPGITTIVQPAADIGARAVQVLLRRIRSTGDTPLPLETVRLPATLVVRESSSEPFSARGAARPRSKKRS
jgi:LacI family transcriptional regulator